MAEQSSYHPAGDALLACIIALMAELQTYHAGVERLAHSRYLDYPLRVSIETLALCNAACDFCPYPTLDRKGAKMSDGLIQKILDDCGDIPKDLPFSITLARVNEPFLDPRIFDVSTRINEQLQNASLNFFSNGTPLTDHNLERLAQLRNINFLNISVNDHREREYERVMQLSYDLMIERLTAIHGFKREGSLGFTVNVSRVMDGTVDDEAFQSWVATNFPLFEVVLLRRSDWNGAMQIDKSPIPDVGCVQWFTLHFLADGRNAFCCLDSTGALGHGLVADEHALAIYNHPRLRRLRQNVVSRLEVENCRNCPLLS